jgi:hypothetical protein
VRERTDVTTPPQDDPFIRHFSVILSWGITVCCLATCVLLLVALITSGRCP